VLSWLRRVPAVSLAIIFISVLAAMFASFLAPHSPIEPDLAHIRLPPFFAERGSYEYLLGTDWQGRDVLSRVIVGAQASLGVAAMCILIGGIIGCVFGLMAGYLGGWIDLLIMRIVDLFLAFPSVLLALIFAVTLGPSFWVVVMILSFLIWPRYARVVRGEVLAWKTRDFIALARIAGARPRRIIFVHILPNVLNSVVVLSTLQVGWAVTGTGIPSGARIQSVDSLSQVHISASATATNHFSEPRSSDAKAASAAPADASLLPTQRRTLSPGTIPVEA